MGVRLKLRFQEVGIPPAPENPPSLKVRLFRLRTPTWAGRVRLGYVGGRVQIPLALAGHSSTTTLKTSVSAVALGFAGNEFNLSKTRKYQPDMGFVRFRNVVILERNLDRV